MTIGTFWPMCGGRKKIKWVMPTMQSNSQDGIVITGTSGAAFQVFDKNSGTSAYYGIASGAKWFNVKLPYKVMITKIECLQNTPGSHDDSRFNYMGFFTDSSQKTLIATANINWNPYNWATTNVTSKIKTNNFYILVRGQAYFGVPEINVEGYKFR